MKNNLLIVIIAILFSCGEPQETSPAQPNDAVDTEETVVTETSSFSPPVLYNEFKTIDPDSSILMLPLNFRVSGLQGSYQDESDSYSFGRMSSDNADKYWNVIFYNYKTESSWLLIDSSKILIANIQKSENNWLIRKKYLFYTIYSDDYNRDKMLTSEDPAYLYISDRTGKNFRRLSTKNMDVVNWNILSGTELVFFTCRMDSNNDKKFDDEDQLNTYRINIADAAAVPKEIFPDTFKKEMFFYYKKHWTPKEK